MSWGSTDLGRFRVSTKAEDRGAFKTPTLRELDRTAPYMHDGSFAGLEDVIEFYDRGGRSNPSLDHEIKALRLTAEQRHDLVAFLLSLSSTR